MSKFWPSIENFHTLRKGTQKYPHLLGSSPKVTYKAKVKLHGTNAGIELFDCINGPTVRALSRTQIISPGNDNAGFAAWVWGNKEKFVSLCHPGRTIVINGEWVGPGIMKGTAVNKLDSKKFMVFAVTIYQDDDVIGFIVDPEDLGSLLEPVSDIVHVIPWYDFGKEYEIDFEKSGEELQCLVEDINKEVLQVEACDPFMKSQFQLEGIGEGLVFYPIDEEHSDYESFSNLCFKAKGEKHQSVAHTKPAQIDPSIANSLTEFAHLVLPVSRLEQGVYAVNNGVLEFDNKKIGLFLKWINEDLFKETQGELEVSGLNSKDAYRKCSEVARTWYLSQMKKL
jgi:hypothetical protein